MTNSILTDTHRENLAQKKLLKINSNQNKGQPIFRLWKRQNDFYGNRTRSIFFGSGISLHRLLLALLRLDHGRHRRRRSRLFAVVLATLREGGEDRRPTILLDLDGFLRAAVGNLLFGFGLRALDLLRLGGFSCLRLGLLVQGEPGSWRKRLYRHYCAYIYKRTFETRPVLVLAHASGQSHPYTARQIINCH